MANERRSPALRFRLLGFPVEVQATFFLIVGLLGWTGDTSDLAIWVTIAFASILVHELGHAIAARSFGSPASIVLHGFGGLTSFRPLSVPRNLVVSLAGAFAGFAVGLVALVVDQVAGPFHGNARIAMLYTLFVNIGWGVVNLLPILPLDGGQALRGIVHIVTGADRESLVRRVSIAVAIGLGLLAFRAGLVFTAFFALFFVGENFRALREQRAREHHIALVEAADALERGDTGTGLAAVERVLADKPDATTTAAARELEAWSALRVGDVARARAALDRFPPTHPPSPHLEGAVCVASGDVDRGMALIVDGFVRGARLSAPVVAEYVAAAGRTSELIDTLLGLDAPVGRPAALQIHAALHDVGRYDDAITAATRLRDAGVDDRGLLAYNLACSSARLGRADDAIDWLTKSIEEGFATRALVDDDPDLDSLRALPRFRDLRSRLG